jgi:hypothetical protein
LYSFLERLAVLAQKQVLAMEALREFPEEVVLEQA